MDNHRESCYWLLFFCPPAVSFCDPGDLPYPCQTCLHHVFTTRRCWMCLNEGEAAVGDHSVSSPDVPVRILLLVCLDGAFCFTFGRTSWVSHTLLFFIFLSWSCSMTSSMVPLLTRVCFPLTLSTVTSLCLKAVHRGVFEDFSHWDADTIVVF